MAMPRKPDEVKHCEHCGVQMHRKRYKSGSLESNIDFRRRKYCGSECASSVISSKPKKEDSSWMTAHYHARSICPPGPCAKCGRAVTTDVHHINGDWHDNRQENLIRLCRSCHMKEHRPKGVCEICGKPTKGLGYCEKHYRRFKKYGDPTMTAYGPRP